MAYSRWAGIATKAKFGNTRSKCALNHSHRSKLESSVCQLLQLQAKAKELIIEATEDNVFLTKARIRYIADFRVRMLPSNEVAWVEAKGHENDRWPMIRKLWQFYGPGRLVVYKGTWQRPVMHEVITPESSDG